MSRLKKAITKKTGIQPSMQKLCYKGATQPDDSKSLRDCGLSANAKILMVGSTAQGRHRREGTTTEAHQESSKGPFTQEGAVLQTRVQRASDGYSQRHKAIIDDGVPDDAFPGISNAHDDLPNEPITGMLNKATQKFSIGNVFAVVSQPIEGQEEYHIMCILPSLVSEPVWLYWVPAQYVRAIKKTMLGR
ncbi:hypothetical protein MTO96_045653 [Rhipicephalus appendiculatus]